MLAESNEKLAGTASVSNARLGSRWASKRHLYLLVPLTLFVFSFVYSTWSWVRFFQSPDVANSNPVALFSQTDFPAITMASRMVSSGRGGDLYNFDAQLQAQRDLISEGYIYQPLAAPLRFPYPYTPFLAVLWSPLSQMSPLAQMAIYDLLNLAAMAVGFWFLLLSLPLPRLQRVLILLSVLTYFPFINNLEQGQGSGITIFSLAVGIALLRRRRDLPAGLALGLLVLKMQWLPILLLVLLCKRRWQALAGVAITATVLLAISFLAMGTAWIPGFLDVVVRAQRFDPLFALAPSLSHSLSGGIAALIGQLNPALRTINTALILAVAGLVIWLWRGKWQPGTPRWDGLVAVTLLAMVLTNLQVNTHDLSLLCLPAALGASYFWQSTEFKHATKMWYGLFWVAYLAPELFLPQIFSAPIRLTTLLMALMLCLLAGLLLRVKGDSPAISRLATASR